MKKGGIKFVEIMLLLVGSFILAYSLIPRIEKISSMGKEENIKIFVKRLNETSAILWSKSLRDGKNGSIKDFTFKNRVIIPDEINFSKLNIHQCGNEMFNVIYQKKLGNTKYVILCRDGNSVMLPKFKLICVKDNN
ncbi:hypothetical protein [Caminibacter pacificus]|uniref:Prepilin-type N-terminal cleavage/methylation domain-containing protein n=1 Tax=Caminibacter pacificus TaxID=1424653 RepID=A0AAJ4RCC2_9BACT|nr:hypothetical protein [Caminibacter pacificus]QCI27965.1 hypothetical protein C6V80_02995 [Caminibacter pacificus]ROR39851.1 hypothetical protein EDC58_0827 [Caminibacter pacificus]